MGAKRIVATFEEKQVFEPPYGIKLMAITEVAGLFRTRAMPMKRLKTVPGWRKSRQGDLSL